VHLFGLIETMHVIVLILTPENVLHSYRRRGRHSSPKMVEK